MKILVAEDNPALAAVTKFNLVRAGHDVTVAEDGRAAWEAAQATAFDFVVTDQQMPEMTGIELSRRLRSHPDYEATPIIMLTAKGLELDLEDLRLTLGISAALPKPFSPTELLRQVELAALDAAEVAAR